MTDTFLFVCLFLLFVFVVVVVLFFETGFFLYIPDYPETQSEHQAGLELRYPPASASQVLGLQV